jgi:hypothetical protein
MTARILFVGRITKIDPHGSSAPTYIVVGSIRIELPTGRLFPAFAKDQSVSVTATLQGENYVAERIILKR